MQKGVIPVGQEKRWWERYRPAGLGAKPAAKKGKLSLPSEDKAHSERRGEWQGKQCWKGICGTNCAEVPLRIQKEDKSTRGAHGN